MFKYITVFLFLLAVSFAGQAKTPQGMYAYETSEFIKVGAVFGVLPDSGIDDKLIQVSSSVCGRVEIHEMKEVDGIMQMRPVPFMKVYKGAETKLDARGYHLMLMELNKPLKDGDKIPLVLTYQNAGQIKIDVPVYSRRMK